MKSPLDRSGAASSSGCEFERKYLLRGLPEIPPDADIWRIEQGYIRPSARSNQNAGGVHEECRLRRVVFPDGRVQFTRTRKRGMGLVRFEEDEVITAETFERDWPNTERRRLRKTRYRVREGDLVWELDEFSDLDLVLAEVELPAADWSVNVPAWLQPHVVREVTDEVEYTNASLALRVIHTRQP